MMARQKRITSERALKAWAAPDASLPFKELIESGKELEARGRELASRREAPIGAEDMQWLTQLRDWHANCASMVRKFESIAFTEVEAGMIDNLNAKNQDLYSTASVGATSGRGRPRKTPISSFVNPAALHDLAEKLQEYNSAQMELTGRSGIWLLGAVPIEQYSWSAFLNDYDSCFHQFLNWLTRKLGDFVEVAPGVYASTRSAPIAVESARMWREAVDLYYAWGLYEPWDYEALAAFIHENKAEFRVGSSVGHATHAEFYPLYARVEYYDDDEIVHVVFMKLAEHYGCAIEEHVEGVHTIVRVPRVSIPAFFQGVLPFVTSMDFRLSEPEKYWCKKFCYKYTELKGKVPPEELEFRLCITAYNGLKADI